MGKEVIVVLGSPREGGNSEQMADALIKGLEKRGHRAVKIHTEQLDTGCCGCGGCYGAENMPCCQHADFNTVAATLLRADGIVFAAHCGTFQQNSQHFINTSGSKQLHTRILLSHLQSSGSS